ncbi:protein FAR1-RELATED SEQUENCE 5-like [Silene latifolia]|uniref:protein FAR1-RELATED SEQUENCE 5-like n=1 Tax=Silene latifolia TaxID=37657 RepID=UPI003D781B3F
MWREITRVGCTAGISFRRLPLGKYEVYNFIEAHSHAMVTPATMIHLMSCRKLNLVHKKMIIDNSHVNQGSVKTFRIFKEYVRGYKNVGASLEYFKNFSRDVKKFIKEYDAEMLIEGFMQKRATCPSFYFDFDVNEEKRLTKVFWANPIAMKKYALFGDSVSFDTKFDFNEYRIVFCPITGVDNHKKCVTFAAGLIMRENEESFIWLFDNFMKAMGGCYHIALITDQCQGIKEGVKNVFSGNTQNRFFMWHIMKKLPDKAGSTIYKDTHFLKEINYIVWNEDIESTQFESSWFSMIEKHDLTGNEWLKSMFDDRNLWIPAYFRDTYMSGFMRTTSRSESENSFFGNITNPNLSLVQFWIRFHFTMDAQRWKHSKLTTDSKNSSPILSTPLSIEKKCAEFYTPTVFYEFQEVLKGACYSCNEANRSTKEGDLEHLFFMDQESKKVYAVDFGGKTFMWSNCAIFRRIFNDVGTSLEADCGSIDTRENNICELWSEVFTSVSLVKDDEEKERELLILLQSFNEKLLLSSGSKKSKSKKTQMETLLGAKIRTKAHILHPNQAKSKVSGRRMNSDKEMAMEEHDKPIRKSRAYGEMAHHDSRSCPS